MTVDVLDGTVPAYWQSAKCNTGDASLVPTFYPEHGGSYRKARDVCRACPVRDECLEFTMSTESSALGGRHGFAGGLTPQERHHLARSGR